MNMSADSLELAQHFEGTQMSIASKWPSINFIWRHLPMALNWPSTLQEHAFRWPRNGPVIYKNMPADGLELAQKLAGTRLPMALNWPNILKEHKCRWPRNGPAFYMVTPADGLELAQHFAGTQLPMASKWPSNLYGDTCRWP